MSVDLEGKIVLVIGGAGLLGFEFVKIILRNNGIVVIADLNEAKCKRPAQL